METKHDIAALKGRLEEEKKLLERELGTLGKKSVSGDWVTSTSDLNNSEADKNEAADRVEDFESKMATESTLEAQLEDIKAALARIENGTYGVCTVGGEPIETERLLANPSARTCIKHKG